MPGPRISADKNVAYRQMSGKIFAREQRQQLTWMANAVLKQADQLSGQPLRAHSVFANISASADLVKNLLKHL